MLQLHRCRRKALLSLEIKEHVATLLERVVVGEVKEVVSEPSVNGMGVSEL
jgi:hypothetical protein